MPWISKRNSKWGSVTRSLRTIWYFRKELKKLYKKDEDDINFNASIWKWLYLWFDSLYRYRLLEQVHIPRAFGPFTPVMNTNAAILNKIPKFEWIAYVSKKLFGHSLVPLYTGNLIVFAKWTKSVRDQSNKINYILKKDWSSYRTSEDIRWCSIQKDWYFHNCFIPVRTYLEDNSYKVLMVANPSFFTCPVCKLNYLDAPQNKARNPYTKQITCLACKRDRPRNEAHTPQSIYGDYHSHYRTGWRFFPCSIPNDETVPLGVELEMQTKAQPPNFNPRDEAWQMYQHQLTGDPKWNLFYCERDGSIGEHGLEMITQPMSQGLHNPFWEHMLPMIRTRFTGWNTNKRHPGGQYGIHITFDSQLYGQLNMARLATFLENKTNQVFVQGIAQRGVLYGSMTPIAHDTKKASQIFQYDKGKLIGSQLRAQCLNLKGPKGLCEIRMFRSTLNTTSFFKNLEFLWAFKQWCGETPWNTTKSAFIAWLLHNPKLYTHYPHLYEYMCHKIFPVDNPRWHTSNTFSATFTDLVTKVKKGQKDLFDPFTPENSDDIN